MGKNEAASSTFHTAHKESQLALSVWARTYWRLNPPFTMFIVFLRFSGGRSQAGQFLEEHKAWIKRGFADGVFLLAGSLEPGLGGGIVAHQTTLDDLRARVNEDPFVVHNVVSAEIHELDPGMADERLQFLVP